MDTFILAEIAIVIALLVAALLVRRAHSNGITVATFEPSQALGDDVNAVARSLLVQGKKIEAIKAVRQRSGICLKEAKDYVDALEAGATPTVPPSSSPPLDNVQKAGEPLEAAYAAMQNGQTLEAIRLVRLATGLGLKEAKDYVDQWQRTGVPPQSRDAIVPQSIDLVHEAQALVAQGNTIGAIKLVREHTGMGLKEAKDYVESL